MRGGMRAVGARATLCLVGATPCVMHLASQWRNPHARIGTRKGIHRETGDACAATAPHSGIRRWCPCSSNASNLTHHVDLQREGVERKGGQPCKCLKMSSAHIPLLLPPAFKCIQNASIPTHPPPLPHTPPLPPTHTHTRARTFMCSIMDPGPALMLYPPLSKVSPLPTRAMDLPLDPPGRECVHECVQARVHMCVAHVCVCACLRGPRNVNTSVMLRLCAAYRPPRWTA